MDKAKSMMDKKGASGPFHVNGQSQRGFHGHVAVAANGSCCSSNIFGSGTGPNTGTFETMHHLHRGDDAECNGSPAKRCRLRRRTESVRRSRPRKCQPASRKPGLFDNNITLHTLFHCFFFSYDSRSGCLLSVWSVKRVNAATLCRLALISQGLHNHAVLQ